MKTRYEFHLFLFLIAFATVLLIRWGSGSAAPVTAKSRQPSALGATASPSGMSGQNPADLSRMD